jgi:hypothetical protein
MPTRVNAESNDRAGFERLHSFDCILLPENYERPDTDFLWIGGAGPFQGSWQRATYHLPDRFAGAGVPPESLIHPCLKRMSIRNPFGTVPGIGSRSPH